MDIEKMEPDNEELDNILCLDDEDGNCCKFEFLDLIEYEERSYLVLLPVDEDGAEADTEVVILQLEETDGVEMYASIEDNNTLDTIFGIFKERFGDLYDFEE